MEGSGSGFVPVTNGYGSRTVIHKQDVYFYSLWNLSRLHCTVLVRDHEGSAKSPPEAEIKNQEQPWSAGRRTSNLATHPAEGDARLPGRDSNTGLPYCSTLRGRTN
jgi:hypothetical protein